MRAAFFVGNGQIEIRDILRPKLGADEILVKVAASGPCGSDRDVYYYGSDIIPGHESAGTVIETGSKSSIEVGTRGSVYLFSWCGSCRACNTGDYGRCLDMRAVYGFTKPGGFSEYMVVKEHSFLPLPENVAVEEAVMLLDVCGTTGHALRRGGIKSAKTVAVLGSGPIGLGTILMAHLLAKPARVYATDIVPYRMKLARALGAKVRDASEKGWLRDFMMEEPDGVDLVLETTGKPENQKIALDICAPGGWLVLVGLGGEKIAQTFEIADSRRFTLQEKFVTGSQYFRMDEFKENLALFKQAKIDPKKIITHEFPLERIAEAYTRFWSGQTGKVLVGQCSWEDEI
jgi:threonine 3-dehydrogenase